jgi:hypothetical protein
LASRPWEHSTGPRTAEGKAKVAANGRRTQEGKHFRRAARRQLADLRGLIAGMGAARRQVTELLAKRT